MADVSNALGEPSRPQQRPFEVKPSDLWRQRPYEVDRYMLADHGELLFKADEMNFIAIRLEPARPAMWVPPLLAGGSVGERDGGGEKILDGVTHARAQQASRVRAPWRGQPSHAAN
jgi:hypothetical protein